MKIVGPIVNQKSLYVFRNFTTIPDKDLYDSLSDLFAKMDTYLWLRDGIFKTASKGVVPKKPIWIGELEILNSFYIYSSPFVLSIIEVEEEDYKKKQKT